MIDFTGKINCTCGKEMKGGVGNHGGTVSCTFKNCDCGIRAIFYTVPKDCDLFFKAEHKDSEKHTEETREKLLAIFKLAGIEVLQSWDIENGYFGGKADWLLLKTKLGLIKIGWRKRVISIDWEDTGIEMIVKDEVTKEKTMCHAWSYGKAVDYLEQLGNASKLVRK